MADRTVVIGEAHKRLEDYIIKYRELRERTTIKGHVQSLIVADAKKLVTGMPEKQWRSNMLTLINEAEAETEA